MQRGLSLIGQTLFGLAGIALAAWLLNLDDLIRASIEAGHLLDWVMGVLCLVWLLLLLKAPWDLYFQAHAALWEIERSEERQVAIPAGRKAYLRRLRGQLLFLAVGAHLGSALLVVAIAHSTGAVAVGYWFALLYVVSTVFRPMIAGYAYLSAKLRGVAEEARYPREDVVTLRAEVNQQTQTLRALSEQMAALQESLQTEQEDRENEVRDLQNRLHRTGREFETAISRLTDNQEVIRGIQSFVRLVTQAGSDRSAA